MKNLKLFYSALPILVILSAVNNFTIYAQQNNLTIRVDPTRVTLNVGDSITLRAQVIDQNGSEIQDRTIIFFSQSGKALLVEREGKIVAALPGSHKITVMSPGSNNNYAKTTYTVNVNYPPLAKIKIENVPSKIYAKTQVHFNIRIFDEAGIERQDLWAQLASANPKVATFSSFYTLKAHQAGSTVITARIEGIQAKLNIEVVPNPVVQVRITNNYEEARTGDVLQFKAQALDKKGKEIKDIPINFSFRGVADDVSSSAAGLIKQDGRFVAEQPGLYTITADSGPYADQKTIKITPRNIQRKLELVGHGTVSDKHTSDFWIWEGVDGKDYAVTGTWGADGTAYFWDVTDPSQIIKIDSVQVDARTVNDVKISENGKVCIISREGASNRRNGIVILDVANPRDVSILSTFDENLTGGVHNLFIYENHVYALSNGQKYLIINIEDPKKPYYVGEFELDTPGHAIHDVWVADGIAHSSNWQDGVVLVDVGNGISGGSPSHPVQFATYSYPSGAHHATFPFKSPSTGKFYSVLGDEIFPYDFNLKGPNIAAGFIHFVDFSDLDNPDEIARFEVPGAGAHNFWIDGEILYVAFYNGGLRVVDISGDLMGDLFKQGREIAWIIPSDPNGYIPNSPFTWGAQIHKGPYILL